MKKKDGPTQVLSEPARQDSVRVGSRIELNVATA